MQEDTDDTFLEGSMGIALKLILRVYLFPIRWWVRSDGDGAKMIYLRRYKWSRL